MDFSRICRICLGSFERQKYDIFTSNYEAKHKVFTKYSDMLSDCTKLKPIVDDGLPRHICKECCRQLKKTYAFNIKCENSDRKLRNYLNIKPEVEVYSIHATKHNKIEDNEKSNENVIVNIENLSEDKNNQSNNNSIFVNGKGTVNSIKLEPSCNEDNEDSCWDAEDNSLLQADKCKRNFTFDLEYTDEDLNKGAKSKTKIEITAVEPRCIKDGNEDSGWDPEDDSILQDFKFNKDLKIKIERYDKELSDYEGKSKQKKKRGRKKLMRLDDDTGVPNSKLPHQCDICGKFLSTKSNLKAHKICHTDLRPYKCVQCPASFKGHSALFQHNKIHTGEKRFHCEYCPKQFSRRTGLVNHIRMHTGEKLYNCDICCKTFVQSGQLSIHMKRHKGEKTYLCQECGKGFPIKSELKVHQRVHNGEKPYNCHLCSKTFATSGNLKIHVRIHNKEIRYNCKECQRGFVSCSAYKVHLKRHKGQRDYHCECGKTFYTSSALKQHKVVHTGEKKYQCKVCERKFTQSSHLSRHFKRDHAKSNTTVPPPNHKLIVNDSFVNIFDDHVDVEVTKVDVPNLNSDVKCEGP